MKIQLNNDVRMSAALDKVAEGKYFDALCLFARVDSYESKLNQIGCLCHLRDIGYALELYRKLLADYYFTHNCLDDVRKISTVTVETLAFFDAAIKGDNYDEKKVSADEQLLGEFEIDDDEGDDFDDAFDDYEESARQNIFCDVKSPDYFFRMVERIQEESNKGNLKKSQEMIRELLQFDSQDESVLEAQMLLCLAERNYEKGVELAEKYAALDNVETYRGVAVALGLLSASEEHKDLLGKMLARLTEFADEIENNELMEYVELAESCFDSNNPLVGKLAEILYDRAKYVGCEALRTCARIFCNMGWKKQAREATLTLLNAVPWDSYATTLLAYVDSNINSKLDKAFGGLLFLRHLDVPPQFAVIAEYKFIARMEAEMTTGEPCILFSDDYKFLDCIVSVCKAHVYRGNSEKFVNDATVFSTILTNFKPQSAKEYFSFAKSQLCSFMPEASVQKDILLQLVKLGYRDKLLMSTSKSYYTLDLSRLKTDSQLFLDAFCLCAALRKVDARRLQRAYDKIRATVELSTELDYVFSRKLAYCLLAVSYKDFVESTTAEYFSEGEDELYIDYLTRRKDFVKANK